jgi:hypothetical protein
MLGGRDADDDAPTLDQGKVSFGKRLKNAMLKPVDPDAPSTTKAPDTPESVEELEAAVKSLSDKERLIGLLCSPFASAIGLLIIDALISHDPTGKLHVSVSLYHELLAVLLVLSVGMLVLSWLRKRLYLGMVTALYGLAVFNLHYWGFGLPFVMVGAWLLVRTYRLNQALKKAGGGTSSYGGTNGAARPQASKRYTPPTSPPKRSSSPKDERKAG